MKISFNWIKDLIDEELDLENCIDLLTDIGLEVEGVSNYSQIKTDLSQLVVGKVVECIKHPNADRLKLTTIDIGENNNLSIVCGAPNVEKNQLVVVAPVNSVLKTKDNTDFKIKKVKIRGVESCGMLCAEDEIGVGNNHSGIIVLDSKHKVGKKVSKIYENYNDKIIEIGLTPNRCDAISHFGVARDLRAALSYRNEKQIELIAPSTSSFTNTIISPNLSIDILDSKDCQRFSGVIINNITVGESPSFIKNKLMALGLKPINNIVDITNYVMHEIGQPLHAYDRNKISSNTIKIQKLKKGTKFTTLDGIERELGDNDLMICDDNTPMCLAGVFGGNFHGVSEKTTSIFLESAFFNPVSVRKSAKYHSLNTDSSYRFERGVDIDNVEYALKRAASLIVEHCNGEIISDIMDDYPSKFDEKNIVLNFENVDRIIGFKLDKLKIKNIINLLDFKINNVTDISAGITIPTYRYDVTRECDVIEEILRIHGYNNIPLSDKQNISISRLTNRSNKYQNIISDYLSAIGFTEIMNNSLVSENDNNSEKSIILLNSLSNDISKMRGDLINGMLKSLSYNLNRQNKNLKFYEFGSVYSLEGNKYIEEKRLTILLCGNLIDNAWNSKNIKSEIFILKNIIENIFLKFNIEPEIKQDNEVLEMNFNSSTAKIKKLDNQLLKKYNIEENNIYYATIPVDELFDNVSENYFKVEKQSKYPKVIRDFSFILNDDIKFIELQKLISNTSKLIKKIDLVDVYKGSQIDNAKKSYSISVTLEEKKKTLDEIEINRISEKIIKNVNKELNGEIRS